MQHPRRRAVPLSVLPVSGQEAVREPNALGSVPVGRDHARGLRIPSDFGRWLPADSHLTPKGRVLMDRALPASPTGADAVPDSRGLNLYRADPDLARVAALYLPSDLTAHLAPHLDRL